MAGAHGGSFERDDAAALEDAVENGFGEVGIVQDATPELQRLVGGEDHRAPTAVALVDDMEEHVGGVRSVDEVSDFVANVELNFEEDFLPGGAADGCWKWGRMPKPAPVGKKSDGLKRQLGSAVWRLLERRLCAEVGEGPRRGGGVRNRAGGAFWQRS